MSDYEYKYKPAIPEFVGGHRMRCPYNVIFLPLPYYISAFTTSDSCPYDIIFRSLFQCQAGEGGEVAGGGEETLGGDGADGLYGLGERDGAAVVEGAAAHGECDLFGIYRADSQLADELAFGRLELAFRQGRGLEGVDYAPRQAQATLHVVGVTAEVDGQQAVVAHQRGRGLDGVDKAVALAQRHVQQRVHARAAEYVEQQGHIYARGVEQSRYAGADDGVGLIGVAGGVYVVEGLADRGHLA